jgi:anti-anti-sigma regulatory factor
MKKKISTLKNQGKNSIVIDVESVLFMEKSVVLVITTECYDLEQM